MKSFFISTILIVFSLTAKSENTEVSIDREAVKVVIQNNLNVFKKCYTDEYKNNKNLAGKVVLAWEINDQGVVAKSSIKSTQVNNENTEKCLTEKVKALSFPKAPTGTIADVQYPFVFKGQ